MLALIFDTCVSRDEILSGDLSLDLFAAKLRLVVEGTAPQVYQNANKFFANTFATDGIKTLIRSTRSQALPGNAYQEALPPIFPSQKQSGASLTPVPRQSLETT